MRDVVVTPWHNEEQRDAFLQAWRIHDYENDPRIVMQHDADADGCGFTKNLGIDAALDRDAEMVVVLDDDCFPLDGMSLDELIALHRENLDELGHVKMFQEVTSPPSRGTPFNERMIEMPVAASMGFWTEVGDYCAPRQLAHQAGPMSTRQQTIFGRYFPLCGMNLAFRPKDWRPWCDFIDVPRFDDIWMGWLWQREAYQRGFCFSLYGPKVRHSRQSNVWKNLEAEARYLEANETLWRTIATHPSHDYDTFRRLLPVAESFAR